MQAKPSPSMSISKDKLSLMQLIGQQANVNYSAQQTPTNNSNSRRISFVMTQGAPTQNQTINQVLTSSVDGRKKSIEKKTKNVFKAVEQSLERQATQKFQNSGLILIKPNDLSNHKKRKQSQQKMQKTMGAAINTTYDEDKLNQLRNATLSPPPTSKEGKMINGVLVSKSSQKCGTASLQKSSQRINQIKSLVKKQQQKSLSRDFNNALMNANMSKTSQFTLMQSQNTSLSNHTLFVNKINQSLSPSRGANSSSKKKKKQPGLKKKKEDGSTNGLIQLFKPPIKKNVPNFLQTSTTSINPLLNSLINDSRADTTINLRKSHDSVEKIRPQQNPHRAQQRSNTQERILKMADENLHQIDQDLVESAVVTQKKPLNKLSKEQTIQKIKKQLTINSVNQSSEYSSMPTMHHQTPTVSVNAPHFQQENNVSATLIPNLANENLFKTVNDIIENLQVHHPQTGSQSQIQQKKQQANITLIKSQLELIKNSYDTLIKRLSDGEKQSNGGKGDVVSQSARQQNLKRILSDRLNEQDEFTTTQSSTNNNDCFSSQSSFRNNQLQLQSKIQELQNENMNLQKQLKQKQETIDTQEMTIQQLKPPVKQSVEIQTMPEQKQMTGRTAEILIENESLKRQVARLEKRVSYHKNKENKFLFFLFTLQNQGIPVNEIYEKEGIKDIPTNRFAEIMGEDQIPQNNNQSSLMFSFYSDDSYEPLNIGPDPAVTRKKPKIVPSLNLNSLPEYESSSDEEDNCPPKVTIGDDNQPQTLEEMQARNKNMNTQDYEQSMKYIENFYNKCQSNGLGGVIHNTKGSTFDDNDERDEDYVLCRINNGSSILMFEKEASQTGIERYGGGNGGASNPGGSMLDDDFCYSIDKNSKRRRSDSKDLKSA